MRCYILWVEKWYELIDTMVNIYGASNYPVEFMNSLKPPGLVGTPIMLLRNLETTLTVQRDLSESQNLTLSYTAIYWEPPFSLGVRKRTLHL